MAVEGVHGCCYEGEMCFHGLAGWGMDWRVRKRQQYTSTLNSLLRQNLRTNPLVALGEAGCRSKMIMQILWLQALEWYKQHSTAGYIVLCKCTNCSSPCPRSFFMHKLTMYNIISLAGTVCGSPSNMWFCLMPFRLSQLAMFCLLCTAGPHNMISLAAT